MKEEEYYERFVWLLMWEEREKCKYIFMNGVAGGVYDVHISVWERDRERDYIVVLSGYVRVRRLYLFDWCI